MNLKLIQHFSILRNILIIVSILPCLTSHAATEFIPFTGYRLSSEFEDLTSGSTFDIEDEKSVGFVINIDQEPGKQIEILYSKQSSALTDNDSFNNPLFGIDIEYFHIGGLIMQPVTEGMNSFIAAGIGVTHFTPDAADYSSETEFSFNLSAGLKQEISEHLGLSAGLRFFGTAVNSNTAIFCRDGKCDIHFSGNLFSQYAATVGVILRF